MGIEPTFEAWEAPVLPLNYTREVLMVPEFTTDTGQEPPPGGGEMMPADEACPLQSLNRADINWSMIDTKQESDDPGGSICVQKPASSRAARPSC